MINLTVVILTLNEEVNIEHSVGNVVGWAKEVFVLDSGSMDKTVEIAESLGAKTFYRKFDNYAAQRNYAIKELPIKTEWMLFLDADEYLPPELKQEIEKELDNPRADGYMIKFRFYFMGRWIKHGGYYGTKILRLFRKEKASVDRDMNEHVVINGIVGELKNDFIHDDHKGITEWISKHNKYATYEALELIKYDERKKNEKKDEFADLFGTQAQRKRWIREYIWNPLMPPLVRPFIYYFYRYFLKLGFLDGKPGFIYHFLQGLWWTFLIDVKYIEMKNKEKEKNV
ncbi:glycosyltransferase family 2 protein [Hydrogenimonas cancrithermarum]|uniref:Glycosyl transferase n=1 Tax=Hydrogenimonas cancrithermarum TaxID=2993563 RepID=A0ABM8FNT6_9BACT|nr:glycosyltransferase family 2 protein [Hydrogenimonas cancrithermarum]BDY13534.1 glycosyl transferase [Hydrogenimonas cancrithermarum]